MTRNENRPPRGNGVGGMGQDRTSYWKYTPAQATYATARLLCDHLAWLLEEQEAAGLPVRQIVLLLARARILSRDLAIVTEQEAGAA